MNELKYDFLASIVVFFVALPLCLGIALASGAPLFSGIIAGVIGGIVVGMASGSPLGVSGPAAGLVVIVLTAIQELGSWEAFLVALVLAGILQIIMGFAKTGFIAYFFPSAVIKGMLSGIGILIIIKQLPHAFGFNTNLMSDLSYFQLNRDMVYQSMQMMWDGITLAAAGIALISLGLLVLWEQVLSKKHQFFQIIPGPVAVVLLGVFLSHLYLSNWIGLDLGEIARVSLPVSKNFADFLSQFRTPDFSVISHFAIWQTAVVLAIVASLETLLCVEATDKLDPYKRVTPTNRELKAQGLGNVISGLIGSLPITQVVVRSSANIAFGARTKISTITHGFLLLISSLGIAELLNLIPLASLAVILIVIGYKLASPSSFRKLYRLGSEQFVPFMTTIIGILAFDLLKGIMMGIAAGLFFTLRHSYRNAYYMKDVITKENAYAIHHLVLAEEVSFFNKASIIHALDSIPSNSKVIIDCVNTKSIAYDVAEFIRDYQINATLKNITVETIGFIPPAR